MYVGMMRLRGLALFALIRTGDSHYDGDEQTNTLAKAAEVSAVTRDAFFPRGVTTALSHPRPPAVAVLPKRLELHRAAPQLHVVEPRPTVAVPSASHLKVKQWPALDRHGSNSAGAGAFVVHLVNLKGVVKEIVYRKDRYTVLRVKLPKGVKGRNTMTLQASNGVLGTVQVGEEIEVRGRITQHKTYGEQFAVDVLDSVVPPEETDEGTIMLLRSGAIKGIGPKMAENLVAAFGNESLDMLRRGDKKLLNLQGMGNKKLAKLQKGAIEYLAKAVDHEALTFALSLGLTLKQAQTLYETYKNEMKTKLAQDPYCILTVMPEIGFDQVDHIARTKLNASVDSLSRAAAAVDNRLRHVEREGHCYADGLQLVAAAQRILACVELSPAAALKVAERALDRMRKLGLVLVVLPPLATQASITTRLNQAVFRPQIWLKEVSVANAVRRRLAETPCPQVPSSSRINQQLSAKQQEAVAYCSAMGADLGRLLILTGGPGTGKTFTVREIVRNWRLQGKRVKLASPTARGAKALSKAVGSPASTMHRLMEYHPAHNRFTRNKDNPLEADAVVIDEASMLDIHIAALFLEALPSHCLILFVGDANQLPSVGPGAVLHDLIASPRVPRVMLTDIFRTDPLGDIARNSALISAGSFPTYYRRVMPQELPQMKEQRPSGCIFVPSTHASEAQTIISTNVVPWLRSVGYDLVEDVQVLAPMKEGPAGINQLNQLLRPQINPTLNQNAEQTSEVEPELEVPIAVGDQMIQLVNNYSAEVLNGDMGIVTDVCPDGRSFKFTVQFDAHDKQIFVSYTASSLGNIVALAYALTVHKSQGSQYEVVCMPVLREHAFMLDRNLLYTGVSRAKRLLVLVGAEDVIAGAIQNKRAYARRTLLQERISKAAMPLL